MCERSERCEYGGCEKLIRSKKYIRTVEDECVRRQEKGVTKREVKKCQRVKGIYRVVKGCASMKYEVVKGIVGVREIRRVENT